MILESRPVRRFTVHPVLPGDKSITLSWGAVAGASEYQIYRGEGVFACDFGKAKAGATTSTTFTDTGLQNGRDYSYVVIPMGPSASCFGPASTCATDKPVGGGGAFPKCVPFAGFCDVLQINSVAGGVLSVTWRNYDCLGSTCECVGKINPGAVPDACPGGNGSAAIRCRAADGCPGDFYWTIDALDGTWDMQSGLPFGGSCWIDELSCVVQDGACPFTPESGLPSFSSSYRP